MARGYENAGFLFQREGDLSRAKKAFEKCLALRKSVPVADRDEYDEYDLAFAYYSLATVDKSHIDKDLLKRAEKILVRLRSKHPQDPRCSQMIQAIHQQLS